MLAPFYSYKVIIDSNYDVEFSKLKKCLITKPRFLNRILDSLPLQGEYNGKFFGVVLNGYFKITGISYSRSIYIPIIVGTIKKNAKDEMYLKVSMREPIPIIMVWLVLVILSIISSGFRLLFLINRSFIISLLLLLVAGCFVAVCYMLLIPFKEGINISKKFLDKVI